MLEEELEEFRLALRQYMECACAQTGCLQSVLILFFHFVSGIPALSYLFLFVYFFTFVRSTACVAKPSYIHGAALLSRTIKNI